MKTTSLAAILFLRFPGAMGRPVVPRRINESAVKLQSSNKSLVVIIWVAIHLLFLFLFFRLNILSRAHLAAEDVGRYKYYADRIVAGDVPYKDFIPEYPPLALALFVFPRLFAHTEGGYKAAFVVLMVAFEFLSLMVILRRETGDPGKTAPHHLPPLSSTFFFVYVLGIGNLVFFRFDIVVAFSILIAVFLAYQNRALLSGILLAIAVGLKGFAVFLVPLFLIYGHFRSGTGWKKRAIVGFGGTSLLIWGPFLLTSYHGVAKSFLVHAGRGIEIGSTYASLLFLGALAGLPVKAVHAPAWFEVAAPLSDSLVRYSTAVLLLLFSFVFVRFFYTMKLDSTRAQESLAKYTTLSILAFMLSFKVFSPQFMTWLAATAPLVSLGSEQKRVVFRYTLVFSAFLTQIMFLNLKQLIDLSPLFLAVQILRNGLLVAVFLATFLERSHEKSV